MAGHSLRRGAWLAAALALALCAGVHAKPTERSKQKAAAEAQRAALQQKLNALKRDIGQTESAKEEAADTLAESEQAISQANRQLRELADEQAQTNARIGELATQRERLAATIAEQKRQLARLLREQYVAGNEDRIKLLLSGDNPNRINRDLQLMSYVSQAQARLIESLRANLVAVEANQAEAQNARDELEEIAQEEQQQKQVLEQQKAKHAALVASLSQKLVSQRQEVGKVERDEQRMGALVDRLNKLIEEQARAAAAEAKRKELLAAARAKAKAEAEARAKAKAEEERLAQAKARAERERLARENRGKTPPAQAPRVAQKPEPKPEPVRPEPKPQVAQREPAKPEPRDEGAAKPADVALAPAAPAGAFASLKGQMRAPLSGRIAAKFGSKRGDGPSWKGVFILAGEGTEVRAVAGGRVVFADWLRGFGNLIIVDHGSQYMSIYGNNQSLLRRAGDVVKAGDVIAAAGNSGGNEESGLYFELRHQGRAFDPAGWVKF
ncbi:peptidoglycan DD-metalloendopeptidase family protein [Pseudoduganella chitinolytica]|uniref:Peptidoglycan DD-metalloendopeptidase family protein n=1 Tax=Pseudoduganella chitinolytica TaxID=34070 RepID=A0ABY8BAA8_9BURK|nr:peptidoglycan DD-metalloendopeptidase family protein [Pseudoduganella chitinolytica]WEF32363.1 peptidoglycan DD-metalloendopeptidase family protein [Pseudoduganella chitinolytica]